MCMETLADLGWRALETSIMPCVTFCGVSAFATLNKHVTYLYVCALLQQRLKC